MQNNHINYIEFKAKDIAATKAFYSNAFGWTFKDYGPSYTAFSESGVYGGFEKTKEDIQNGVLVVLYHDNLVKIKEKIIQNGGTISVDIFIFPGGRRFHFLDPSGNELAVWSE
jgi:predicted enzyme related to lactoylglutathione lyase